MRFFMLRSSIDATTPRPSLTTSNPPSFPPIYSRAHPFFILARWFSIDVTLFDSTFQWLGKIHDKIQFNVIGVQCVWRRGISPDSSAYGESWCFNSCASASSVQDSPAEESPSGAPRPLKRSRSPSASSVSPRAMKVARVIDGDVHGSTSDDLDECVLWSSQVDLWLSRLPRGAALLEPKAPRDRQLRAYGKEKAMNIKDKDTWMHWKAEWERRRAAVEDPDGESEKGRDTRSKSKRKEERLALAELSAAEA